MNQDRSRRSIDPDLAQHDRDNARSHQNDRAAPSRQAPWPKDDQRSSSRMAAASDHLTPEERDTTWPLG